MSQSREPLFAIDVRRLGTVLKTARAALGFSFRDLSNRCGVSPSQLVRIESGEFEYSLEKCYRAASALGVPFGDLVEFCSMINWKARPLERSPELLQLMKGSKKPLDRAWPRLESFIQELSTLTASLLLSSDPIGEAIALTRSAAFEETEECFPEFASLLSGFSNVERLAMLHALQRNPYDKLKSLGLIKPAWILWAIEQKHPWAAPRFIPDSINAILRQEM